MNCAPRNRIEFVSIKRSVLSISLREVLMSADLLTCPSIPRFFLIKLKSFEAPTLQLIIFVFMLVNQILFRFGEFVWWTGDLVQGEACLKRWDVHESIQPSTYCDQHQINATTDQLAIKAIKSSIDGVITMHSFKSSCDAKPFTIRF
jgi:hypothetical protein